jgi:carbon monoxide dehydrogenase subunit G
MNPHWIPRRAAVITPLLLSVAGLLAVLPTHSEAAAAPQVSEMRTVPEFQAIALSGAMDLVVRQGAAQAVEVKTEDKFLPQLETVVEGSGASATLKLRWKQGEGKSWSSGRSTYPKVLVTVVVPKLTAIATAGSGDIRVEAFTTPALQVSLSGAGNAKLESLTTDELGVRISGSGDLSAQGTAARVKVSIAGSGDVRLSDLRADEVSVSIAGSGDAAVNAQKTLSISVAGSGNVTYTGNAAVKSSVAGSGSVTKK